MTSSLFQTLHISSQSLSNRMLNLDTISNNIANMNTNGFRSSRLNFQELITATNLDGTKQSTSQISTQQGSLITTDNPLDWAIEGEGFFVVTLPNGAKGYTRDGTFHLDSKSQLVNSSGYKLSWSGTIPTDTASVNIAQTGEVTAVLQDGTSQSLGTVQLATFPNPSGLTNYGDNIWTANGSSGAATLANPGSTGVGVIKSSAYESSNVNLTGEMANLILVQRGFQLTSRVFQQTDTMLSEAIRLRKA